MKNNNKRIAQQAAAQRKRDERAAKHTAMMAAHATRREAIDTYNAGYDMWVKAGCIGPMPIHPDVAKERAEERRMAAQRDAGYEDLIAAAAELGIELHA